MPTRSPRDGKQRERRQPNTPSGREIDKLLKIANEQHKGFLGARQSAVEHARKAGNALNEIKAMIQPLSRAGITTYIHLGESRPTAWMEWVAKYFDGSHESANLYQRIAREWETIEPLLEKEDNASMTRVLSYLRMKKKRGNDEPEPDPKNHKERVEHVRRVLKGREVRTILAGQFQKYLHHNFSPEELRWIKSSCFDYLEKLFARLKQRVQKHFAEKQAKKASEPAPAATNGKEPQTNGHQTNGHQANGKEPQTNGKAAHSRKTAARRNGTKTA